MKKLSFTLAILALNTSALAVASTALPKGSVALQPIPGHVVKVESLCPPRAMCYVGGTAVTLRFTLQGCLDSLGPVTYKAVQGHSQGRAWIDLYISALNVHNEASDRARCIVAPTQEMRLDLYAQYGEVQTHFLGAEDEVMPQ